MIRVLLVDDHKLLRQGLHRLADAEGDFEIVGEAADGREAVAAATETGADVVVMDLAMPGLNGLDATRRIRRARPQTKVLVLSSYLDDEYLAQAVGAGVSGYMLKDAPPEELFDAVRRVAGGERVFAAQIDRKLLERIESGRRRPRQTKAKSLTHREREVMKLLAEGHTVKEVAAQLGLSQKTVDTHKTNLMKKLDIHNRVELVRYAIDEKLIELG